MRCAVDAGRTIAHVEMKGEVAGRGGCGGRNVVMAVTLVVVAMGMRGVELY
jgi:hypothetical protein